MPYLSPHAPDIVERHLTSATGPWRLVEVVAGSLGPILARVWGSPEGLCAGDSIASLLGVPRGRAAELFGGSVEVRGICTGAVVHEGSALGLLQTSSPVPDTQLSALGEALGEGLVQHGPGKGHALVMADGKCQSWSVDADPEQRARWLAAFSASDGPLVALDGWLAHVAPLRGRDQQLVTLRATELVSVPAMARLSPTQLRVAGRWARGETAQEIADALSRGTETVRTHLREVYRRLGISSRLELVGHQHQWDSWGWVDGSVSSAAAPAGRSGDAPR